MTALLLAVTFSGCSLFGAARLTEKEYKEQVTDLLAEYLFTISDAVNVLYKSPGEYDIDDFLDVLKDTKENVEEGLKTANGYLDQVKKLNPPKEMQDFHNDLLLAVEKAQSMKDKVLAVCDAKSEEKFKSALEKLNAAYEKVSMTFQMLGEDDNEWFLKEIFDKYGDDFI